MLHHGGMRFGDGPEGDRRRRTRPHGQPPFGSWAGKRKIPVLPRGISMTSPSEKPAPPPGVRLEGSTDALPLSPALGVSLDATRMPRRSTLVDRRVLRITAVSVVLGVAAALIAQVLTSLIGLVTNLAFYGRVSTAFSSPAGNHL